MNVIGLDLSLTSTGVAYRDDGGSTIKPGRFLGAQRLLRLRNLIVDRVKHEQATLVAIEGYSYGSRASHAHSLGELGGVVRATLYELGIRYVDIPPKCLKKWATGTGNASKDKVLASIAARTGIAFGNNDECDAWCLRAMALDHYGQAIVTMPAANRTGLTGVDWGDDA